MADRKHRCGGVLAAQNVQVVLEKDGMSFGYVVPGLVCDRCTEQLIDRKIALELQASQTPTVAWHAEAVATTQLNATVFEPVRASSVVPAAA